MKLKKVQILALIAAIVFGTLLFLFLNSLKETSEKASQQVSVVTAAVNIPSNTEITANMLEIKPLPAEVIQPGALTDTSQVIGRFATSNIVAGEQILVAKMVMPGGGDAAVLSYAIAPGMRAITIPIADAPAGLAWLIKPQDVVDIIAQFETTEGDKPVSHTTLIVENITVLAVDSVLAREGKPNGEDGMPLAYSNITLQVTPRQAMDLSMAAAKGPLRAILRSPLDKKINQLPSLTFEQIKTK